MSTHTEIKALVQTYLTAWNARDFSGMAALFTEPATYILPDGPLCLSDRDALIDKLKQQFASMEADGFDRTEIGGIEVKTCSETTAMLDMKNVARLRVDGSALDVLDAVYICVLQDGQWKLSVAMACTPGWRAE